MSSSLPVMVSLWAFHGLVQSVGWPSVTNVFLAWFPDPATRGAWYSLLSTCQNAGAATVPLVLSFAMNYYGWKAALYVPAVSCAMMAMVLLLCLHGSPAAAQTYHGGAKGLSREAATPAVRRPPSVKLLVETVLFNKSLWLMGVNYFCISMVRTCLSDWSAVFLPESKGLSLPAAASALFFMETGGFVGSLAAGWISDRLFAGRRGPVVCICSSMLAPGLLATRWVTSPLLIQACYFYIGFCAFPVHVLLGLFSREVVPPSVGSSAGGFVKCIAQAGGAFAGLPLGALQQRAVRARWHGHPVGLLRTAPLGRGGGREQNHGAQRLRGGFCQHAEYCVRGRRIVRIVQKAGVMARLHPASSLHSTHTCTSSHPHHLAPAVTYLHT